MRRNDLWVYRRSNLAIMTLAAMSLCAASAAATQQDGLGADRANSVVITDVTVLPMTRGSSVLRNRSVLVTGGRIARIAQASVFKGPAGVAVIDGRGKYLMPGLADMHIHMENDEILAKIYPGKAPVGVFKTADLSLPYVANGVLQLFNLSASPAAMAQRDEIESGRVVGPHMALAVMIDGNPPLQPMANVAMTPEAGRKLVKDAATGGFEAIKTYTNLDLATFNAVVDEARTKHLKVLGHLPLREKDRTAELLQPGFGMVAHAEEYAYQTPKVDTEAIPRFTSLAKRTGTWLITTVKLNERIVEQTETIDSLKSRPEMRYVNPFTYQSWTQQNSYAASADKLPKRKSVVAFNAKLVASFHGAGVPMVVGTDSMVSGIVPGFALHDELEALAKLGLPNGSILAAATRAPAEYLGVIKDRGTVEVGKRADLLLLEADPLSDVANTRKIAAVILSGKVYPRSELDREMAALARRYAGPSKLAASSVTLGGHFAPEDEND